METKYEKFFNAEFREALKRDAVRAFVYGLVIIAMLIGTARLYQGIAGQSYHVQRAIACELGVPAKDGIRDPEKLRNCWTDEGLEPPAYFLEG